jgi:hypothetical protein
MRRGDASAIGHGEAVARSQGWRGWFAGRTAWRDIVDRSGLPEEIRALIARLTLAAGGSGRERTETAAELVSHFVEAIERGATPDEARQRSDGQFAASEALSRRLGGGRAGRRLSDLPESLSDMACSRFASTSPSRRSPSTR